MQGKTRVSSSDLKLVSSTLTAMGMALVLGTAGHGLSAAGTPPPQPEASQEALLDRAKQPAPLRFTPCAENPSLDCGTLLVPVDYDKPYGDSVGIAVIRRGPRTRAAESASWSAIPGGPGISGVDFVLGVAQAPGLVPAA